jgi:polar amino acid transport system substrate-binding protein
VTDVSRRWLLACLLAACLAATAAAQNDLDKDRLLWGADSDGGAPYVFKDPADPERHLGFEVDLAEALSRAIGKPIVFTPYQFDSIIPGVERGDIDIGMNGLEITPDRKKRVRFSRPYYIYRLQLVVREGEDRFKDLDDLKGKEFIVGTLSGSVGERALDRRGIPRKSYDDQRGPYEDLRLGRIDGVLLDLPIAYYYARKPFQKMSPSHIPGLQFLGEPVDPGYYAIAVNKKDTALAEKIDTALETLVRTGELQRLYKRYGLWNVDQVRLDEATVDVPASEFIAPVWPADEHAKAEAGLAGDDVGMRSYTFAGFFPLLLRGAVFTVVITFASMLLAVVLALPIALCRLYGPAPLRMLAVGYVEFFRGIPILLLLYFIYYGLPGLAMEFNLPFTLKLDPYTAAILGFGLTYAAYEAEIYRAGISAIPHGQWEAAMSLGMSPALAFRRVILPQTIRVILPPSTNDLVALFKDTSVVSVIAVVELTKQYQSLTKNGASFLQVGLATAALYLIMSVPLGYLSRYLEKVWGGHEHG